MRCSLRRLRGVIGIGLVFAALWVAVLFGLAAVIVTLRPQDVGPGEGPARIAVVLGGLGLISGAAYAVLFALAERGTAPPQLSPGRAALWGILSTAVFPLLTGRADQTILMCPIGAAVGAALVAVARNAARTDALSRFIGGLVRDAADPAWRRPA